MMKFTNFCGIFATLFVTTTIILLASCSQDDDYYENSEMYTLAEMGTRLGGKGDPGGNDPNPPIPHFGNPVQEGGDTIKFDVENREMEVFIYWSRGYTGMTAPVSEITVTQHYWDIPSNSGITYVNSTGEWVGPNNEMRIRVDYWKDSIIVKEHSDHSTEYIHSSFFKKFFYEYTPTCNPDSTLQPL